MTSTDATESNLSINLLFKVISLELVISYPAISSERTDFSIMFRKVIEL